MKIRRYPLLFPALLILLLLFSVAALAEGLPENSLPRTMYSNNILAICAAVHPDGSAIWTGLTFPLIER